MNSMSSPPISEFIAKFLGWDISEGLSTDQVSIVAAANAWAKSVTQAAPVSLRPDVLEELLAHIQWMKEHGELRIKQTRDSVELNAFNQGRVDAAESLLGFMNDLLKQHEVTLTPSNSAKET